MSRAPIRILTVTCGRDVIGTIKQTGHRQFVAVLPRGGRKLGPFLTQADAANAISSDNNKDDGAQP